MIIVLSLFFWALDSIPSWPATIRLRSEVT
jgi:preprotein translocase subunit SecE